MILPINNNPRIKAYLHHAVIHAIIDFPEIMRIQIKERERDSWDVESENTTYSCQGDTLVVFRDGNKTEKSQFTYHRICQKEDELIVSVEVIKFLQRGATLSLFGGMQIEEGTISVYTKYYFQIHQYGLTVLEDGRIINNFPWDTHKASWFKIAREEDKLSCYASEDYKTWILVDSYELDMHSKLISIGIDYTSKANDEYLDWLAMNYIQLCYNKNDNIGKVFLDYRMFPVKNYHYEYRNADQFLDISYVSLKELLNVFPDVTNFLRMCLKRNYYVSMCLDEYYIPGRKYYQKKHRYHHNLFYGYNDEDFSFKIMGYSTFLLSAEICEHSLKEMEFDQETTVMLYKNSYNMVELHLNTDNILFQLERFYKGCNLDEYLGNTLADNECQYGLKVFEELLYTEEGRKLLIYDERISYLLYEHAEIMNWRIGYLCDKCKLDYSLDGDIVELGNKMLDSASILKNMVVKNKIKKGIEERIIISLKNLYDYEKELVGALIKRL